MWCVFPIRSNIVFTFVNTLTICWSIRQSSIFGGNGVFKFKGRIFHIFCNNLKRGLQYQIYSTFSSHFLCWKYFDESFLDKNLLRISLTKFNKLNKRRKRTFLINHFTFALYLAFIFSTFSAYL